MKPTLSIGNITKLVVAIIANALAKTTVLIFAFIALVMITVVFRVLETFTYTEVFIRHWIGHGADTAYMILVWFPYLAGAMLVLAIIESAITVKRWPKERPAVFAFRGTIDAIRRR